jgi:hypothetical protein
MPLILGTNSIKDTGFDVDNSLRFNDGSSDNLTRTISSGDDMTAFTFSLWVKRSTVGPTQRIFSSDHTDSKDMYIRFESNDQFGMYHRRTDSENVISGFQTAAVFKDTSAWYHFVINMDSTNSEADRIKMYVNGTRVVTFAGTVHYPTSGEYANFFNSSEKTDIGYYRTGTNEHFDGYLAEVVAIQGTAYQASDFGEFDEDSGIWKPIDVSGLTFGTNGFYLDFENSGSLGADVSGNGNHFTVNNLTSVDQSTDTCTNNFATLNPLIIFGANNSEFKEGNLVYDDNRADWRASVGTFGVQSGKWYWEMKLGSGTFHQVGIVGTTSPTSSANLIDLSQVHGGYSFYNDNGNLIARTNGGTISGWDSGTVGTSASTGDILMVALDMDNKFLYFGKNGTWVKSGDPTSGLSGTGAINISSDFTTGIDALPGVSMYSGSDGSLNFGSPAFAISSGNSDGNGYGNFEYAVPSGYYALNTKNLAEYG